MPPVKERSGLSSMGESAQRLYDDRLKSELEARYLGKAVAIHVDSEDYAIGDTHREAAQKLLARHPRDGRIVTLTIGPPTDSDIRLASRISSGWKR